MVVPSGEEGKRGPDPLYLFLYISDLLYQLCFICVFVMLFLSTLLLLCYVYMCYASCYDCCFSARGEQAGQGGGAAAERSTQVKGLRPISAGCRKFDSRIILSLRVEFSLS